MRTLYAACVAVSATCTAFADTTMDFDGQGGEQPQKILVKAGKVLMRSGGGEDMLYDERQKRITIIDHASRSYFVMDPASMNEHAQAMQAQSQEQMQQLQAELGPVMEQMRQEIQALLQDPGIPEWQREMLERQMAEMEGGAGDAPSAPVLGTHAPGAMSVKATGEKRDVAGMTCAVHVVSQGTEAMEEVCVATHKAAGVPEADYQTMRSMFAFMREMAEQAMGGGGGHVMPDFDGVPVQIRDLEDGSVSTLRAVSTKRIDPGALTVPAGYQQQDTFQ